MKVIRHEHELVKQVLLLIPIMQQSVDKELRHSIRLEEVLFLQ
jgi:hypothetical protein